MSPAHAVPRSRPRSPHDRPRPSASSRLFPCLAAMGLAALAACENQPLDANATSNSKNEHSLIGGFAANDARLDSIGTMVMVPPLGPPELICGASVIGPETVLTAKHCARVIPMAMQEGFKIAFAVGPNVAAPKQLIEVASFATSPGDVGGFVGMGTDVAILHLEHPIRGLTPLLIGQLTDEQIGKPFSAVGYGIQDNLENFGTRRLGRQTLKATEGRVWEALFGTFDNFFAWATTGEAPGADGDQPGVPVPSDTPAIASDAGRPVLDGGIATDGGTATDAGAPPGPTSLEDFFREIWDATLLLEDNEVVTGGAPGDAQPCFGDSGSSLIRYQNGRFVSYGVVSGGIGSRELLCDMGTVYATFGPEVAAFLAKSLKWTDPCADIDTRGTCDGNVARRCTNLAEGRRRLTDFDCSLFGMTCNTQGAGKQVSCDNNPLGPPPRPMPRPTAAADIQKMVAHSFTPKPR